MDPITYLTERYDEAQQRAELAQQVIAGTWDSWEVVAQQLHACCDTVPGIGRVGQLLQVDADPARPGSSPISQRSGNCSRSGSGRKPHGTLRTPASSRTRSCSSSSPRTASARGGRTMTGGSSMNEREIVRFLNRRLDEDELWAMEASRCWDNPVPEGGVHWQWVRSEGDIVVEIDTTTMEYVDEGRGISLRSRETFPSKYNKWSLPQFAISSAEEVPVAVGGHILRHDPAHVLAEVEAKRAVMKHCTVMIDHAVPGSAVAQLCINVLVSMAPPYKDRPGYNPAWSRE